MATPVTDDGNEDFASSGSSGYYEWSKSILALAQTSLRIISVLRWGTKIRCRSRPSST